MVTASYILFMVLKVIYLVKVHTSYQSIVCSLFFQLQLMGRLRPGSMIIWDQGLTMMLLGDGALLCFTVLMAVGQ